MDNQFSVGALSTLAIGATIMIINRDEKKPTKQDLLNHSDISYKGIGTIIAAVGAIWFVTSIIHKK